jgi:hypothetical protein
MAAFCVTLLAGALLGKVAASLSPSDERAGFIN